MYTLLGVLLVLLLILVTASLAQLFRQAVTGALQVDVILMLLGLKTIGNLVFILPISFYLAILLSLSRLYKDNEMVALAACGIGQIRILRSVLFLALILAIIVASLTLFLAPWAGQQTERITAQVQAASDIEGISAGRFTQFTQGIGATYVQELSDDKLTMSNVFIQKQLPDSQITMTARSGKKQIDKETNDEFLVLENGFRYQGQAGQPDYTIVEFEKHGVRIYEREVVNVDYRMKSISTIEIWQKRGHTHLVELQWRLSTAVLCFVLAIIAVPLSRTSPRQGQYAKLTLAILLYISYSNLLNILRAWVDKGEIPIYPGIWWVHGLMLVIAILIIFKQSGIRHFFLGQKKHK